jgi:hypothetical protein
MKKLSLLVVISLFSSVLLAQTIKMSKKELNRQLDAVLTEAHLLYKYEKATWISIDLALENETVKKDYGGFFTYEEQGEMRVIMLGKKIQNCIAEYSFESDFSKPKSVKTESRELSDKEKKLLEVREKIVDNLSDEKYAVTIPEGYSPNLILLPFAEKYKLYIIMGTSQSDVIPFGNDYLFIADKNGNIENWQKFHSRIIPGYTTMNGYKVTELTHSHLRTTPLITATDICTFMLYAPLYDIDAFSVYSPALGKYMTYSLKSNKITVKEK